MFHDQFTLSDVLMERIKKSSKAVFSRVQKNALRDVPFPFTASNHHTFRASLTAPS